MSTDGHLPLYLAPSTIRFCPLCGSDLVRVPLPPDQKEEAVCSTCGFVFYLNPKVVAGTIPAEGGPGRPGRDRRVPGARGRRGAPAESRDPGVRLAQPRGDSVG